MTSVGRHNQQAKQETTRESFKSQHESAKKGGINKQEYGELKESFFSQVDHAKKDGVISAKEQEGLYESAQTVLGMASEVEEGKLGVRDPALATALGMKSLTHPMAQNVKPKESFLSQLSELEAHRDKEAESKPNIFSRAWDAVKNFFSPKEAAAAELGDHDRGNNGRDADSGLGQSGNRDGGAGHRGDGWH